MTELAALLGDDDALLVLEDADFIDDASWGALSAVCSRKRIPTIVSRLPGSSRHRVGNQLEGLSIAPGFGVRLGPLGFDELAAVIERATGHPMHPSTTSSVFAESGGNVGLALTMVRAAIHDGKMQLDRGSWVASGTFWSNALIPYVDALLAELTDEQWDALEILALLGIVELDTLVEFTGHEVPTQLEDLALIGLYPSAGRLLVTVQPPLLVDFFRQRPAAARRHKLSKMLEAHLGGDTAKAIPFHLPELTATPDAPFVRLVHEHLRNRMLVAQSEWSRSPSRTTLANLIEISVSAGATQEELEELFDLAAGLPAEASEAIMVRWVLLQVDHWLFISREFDRALTTLVEESGRFPRLGPLLNVRAFEVQGALLPQADPDLLPDPKDTRLDVRVRVAVHEALGAHLLRDGNPAAARAHYAAAESIDVRPPSIERTGFVIMTEYFGGHPDLARTYAEQGLAAARESFDNLAIRGFCYISALIDIFDGRYWRAEESIRLALSLGEPIRQPPFVHLSLIVMGAVLAAVRGDLRTAQLLQAQYEALPVPDSLLPGGTRAGHRLTSRRPRATPPLVRIWLRRAATSCGPGGRSSTQASRISPRSISTQRPIGSTASASVSRASRLNISRGGWNCSNQSWREPLARLRQRERSWRQADSTATRSPRTGWLRTWPRRRATPPRQRLTSSSTTSSAPSSPVRNSGTSTLRTSDRN